MRQAAISNQGAKLNQSPRLIRTRKLRFEAIKVVFNIEMDSPRKAIAAQPEVRA